MNKEKLGNVVLFCLVALLVFLGADGVRDAAYNRGMKDGYASAQSIALHAIIGNGINCQLSMNPITAEMME